MGLHSDEDIRKATPVHVHPLLHRHFSADPEVTHMTGDQIYAGEFPDLKLVKLPAIKFRFTGATAATPPALNRWTHVGQVDCYAASELDADDLADRVMRALFRLDQTSHPEGFVGTVSPWDVESTVDTSWSPPRPRRIVSVTLTTRRS